MRELVRGLHQGQQLAAAPTGRTHDCTRPSAERQNILASQRPFSNRISSVKTSSSRLYRSPRGHGSLRGRRRPPHHPARSAGSPMSTTGSWRLPLCDPTASRGVARTLAPEGKHTVSTRPPDGFLLRLQTAISCLSQRNGSPVRQMLCKRTASLRARATRALFVPDRLAIFIAQILRANGR